MLIVFSEVLIALAKERLTQKQKLILVYLKDNDNSLTVTSLVSVLSMHLKCSSSSVWNNVRPLKKSYLVDYGSLMQKGIPVRLTKVGAMVSKELEVTKNGT